MKMQTKKILLIISFVVAIIASATTIYFLLGKNNDSVTAAIMRLADTEGEVTLIDEDAKEMVIQTGMRLFDGNSLTTDTDSYAFINLDDSKAVKLDENSSCTLKKQDKQLEVLLSEGGLFFNVTTKLADDELFEIKTSTMITSIRGTAGYVKVENGDISSVALLTGRVELTLITEDGKEVKTSISAGEVAHTNIDKDDIIVDKMNVSSLPSYVIDAISDDEELLQESSEQGDIDFSPIFDDDDNENDDDDDNENEDEVDSDDVDDDIDDDDSESSSDDDDLVDNDSDDEVDDNDVDEDVSESEAEDNSQTESSSDSDEIEDEIDEDEDDEDEDIVSSEDESYSDDDDDDD